MEEQRIPQKFAEPTCKTSVENTNPPPSTSLKTKSRKTEKWSLLYANVRGLKSKISCIKEIFADTKPDIALFTETHLTENKGLKVDGYTFFGKARQKGKGGGVGIFVKEEKKC